MAGAGFKKRSRDEAPRSKPVRPSKKQKKQAHAAYHSSSESEGASDADDGGGDDDFQAVNLLDSDEEDIHNAPVDDGADSAANSDDGSTSESEVERAPPKKRQSAPTIAKNAPASKLAKDAPASGSESNSDEPAAEDDDDEYSDLDNEDEDEHEDEAGSNDGEGHQDGDATGSQKRRSKSSAKRNDPAAFATSLSKILNTKLSTTRRADPVLARSAAAHEASRLAVDNALETKARKKMRDAKRLAMEKGRVRDVLVATNGTFGANVNPVTGEVGPMMMEAGGAETAGQRLATERRLRKVAQRGVVQLFNAFRTAQVKAVEAEQVAKKEGVVGVDRKKEKVTELSKKGFLDLIAAGGGGLKKAPIEEA